VGGNRARLLPDSNATIASMVADIDAAQDHVHLTAYIWLPDNNGLKMVEALKRAAARKVICRTMADGLGSRSMIASEHWKGRVAGVALLALGVACWLAQHDAQSCAARGLVSAMVLYNLGAVVILGAAGLQSQSVGIALWPAVILHAVMAVWCIVCLRDSPKNVTN
jgi:hypothetical protein